MEADMINRSDIGLPVANSKKVLQTGIYKSVRTGLFLKSIIATRVIKQYADACFHF